MKEIKMRRTQRLIIVVGKVSERVLEEVSGFLACTLIKSVEEAKIKNVYHFNKNAVHLAEQYNFEWKKYNPVVIKLTSSKTSIENSMLNENNILEDFPKIMESYDIDVGDHKSHESNGCQPIEKCLLCKIKNRQTEQPEHIVYESDNFYVVPGAGAFFDGYLMIVPKDHVMSFANLPEEKLEEFWTVLDDMRTILKAIYNKPIFAFECGSGRTGKGKHETSIVHAHFHLAPTDMPVLEQVQKSGLHPALIEKKSLVKYGEHPYMLYVDQEDNWYIASNPQEYYPRQHPRQVLANYMGIYEFYNWRIYPFREKLDVIASEFRNFCKDEYENLTKWQKACVRFED